MAEGLPGYEFHEDISQILAGVPLSEINKLCCFDQLEELGGEPNDDDSNPPDTVENSELDLIPDLIEGEDFGLTRNEGNTNRGLSSGDNATEQLLNREIADQDALLLIYPAARLENNSIRTSEYKVVVKRLLNEWTLSGHRTNDNEWLSHGDLKSPHAYACIFRRLRAELRFVQSEEGFDAKNQSDPTSFYTCLGDLHDDMNEGCKHLVVRDGEVNVYKETQLYEDCLFSMAEVLQNRQG